MGHTYLLAKVLVLPQKPPHLVYFQRVYGVLQQVAVGVFTSCSFLEIVRETNPAESKPEGIQLYPTAWEKSNP